MVRVGDAEPADVRLLHPEEGLSRRRPRLPANRLDDCKRSRARTSSLVLPALPARLFHEGLGGQEPTARRSSTSCSAASLSQRRPFRRPRAGARPPRHPDSRTRRSSDSSTSSTPTNGTSTTGRCAPTTRSTLTSWATSSRSTSTRSRWGPTTPRRTSPIHQPNTLIPLLFEQPRRNTRSPSNQRRSFGASFRRSRSVLPRYRPARHHYDVHRTRSRAKAEAAARHRNGRDDVSKRVGWNSPAPADYAIPTETWREHVARRQRYDQVRAKLAAGEVRSINDLIT